MRPETRKAMEMLYRAKWNVPQAASHCGLTTKEVKVVFSEFCQLHPPNWEENNQLPLQF